MSIFSRFALALLLFTRAGMSDEQRGMENVLKSWTNHAQEPVAPYPYIEEEISFMNPNDGVTLAGTLTLPRSLAPVPVVILLHGSAPLDRNHPMFGYKPFLVCADYFTRRGIAVLRFDKRGAGMSSGDYDVATIEDFAKDALAGVAFLKTRKEINAKQIGLVGLSEGSMTAALAASQSTDVAFAVLMASPTTNWEEVVRTQTTLLQRVDQVPEDVIEENNKRLQDVFCIIKEEKNREIAEKRLRAFLTESLTKLTPERRKITETYFGDLEAQIKLYNATWYRYYFTYDPVLQLKQLKIPVLALNGSLDFIIPASNLPRIAQALQEAGNLDYTILELPKLNHFFQTCQTGSMKEFGMSEEVIAPSVLQLITEWIRHRTVTNVNILEQRA